MCGESLVAHRFALKPSMFHKSWYIYNSYRYSGLRNSNSTSYCSDFAFVVNIAATPEEKSSSLNSRRNTQALTSSEGIQKRISHVFNSSHTSSLGNSRVAVCARFCILSKILQRNYILNVPLIITPFLSEVSQGPSNVSQNPSSSDLPSMSSRYPMSIRGRARKC